MSDKPIIFSGPMVLAILDGRKTQTRRLVKNGKPCRYKVGDRLWVKENAYIAQKQFGTFNNCCDREGDGRMVGYSASMDGDAVRCANDYGVRELSSIYMPRWASRLSLDMLAVRREPLQAITEADALAEGFDSTGSFSAYWDSLHGKRGNGWETNPEVDVITFRSLTP